MRRAHTSMSDKKMPASDKTAMGVAKQRLIETCMPEAERVVTDPYAEYFVPGASVIKCMGGPCNVWLGDKILPGVHQLLIARTRHFDEEVMAAVMAGATQFVMLGAGYDARGYRLPLPKTVKVFEVDQPDVQALKKARLAGVPGLALDAVSFVPVDFAVDSLEAELKRCPGFDPAAKSVFLLEGVTQYISKTATSSTLKSLGKLCGRGSRIVVSYVDQNTYDAPAKVCGSGYPAPEKKVGLLVSLAARVSEPWISGWSQADFAAFLKSTSTFPKVLSDVSIDVLGERYFAPLGRPIPAEELLLVERYAVATN